MRKTDWVHECRNGLVIWFMDERLSGRVTGEGDV